MIEKSYVAHPGVGNPDGSVKERSMLVTDSRPCSHTAHSPTHAFGAGNVCDLIDPTVDIFEKTG